jgi:hypothetical protein
VSNGSCWRKAAVQSAADAIDAMEREHDISVTAD